MHIFQRENRVTPAAHGAKTRLLLKFTDGLYTKETRAHTHRELIREWPWEPTGSLSSTGSELLTAVLS